MTRATIRCLARGAGLRAAAAPVAQPAPAMPFSPQLFERRAGGRTGYPIPPPPAGRTPNAPVAAASLGGGRPSARPLVAATPPGGGPERVATAAPREGEIEPAPRSASTVPHRAREVSIRLARAWLAPEAAPERALPGDTGQAGTPAPEKGFDFDLDEEPEPAPDQEAQDARRDVFGVLTRATPSTPRRFTRRWRTPWMRTAPSRRPVSW